MTREEFRNALLARHPGWEVRFSESGKALWVDVVTTNKRWFTIEYVPGEGVGISEPIGDDIWFGGHDEAFDDFIQVLPYIESQLSTT